MTNNNITNQESDKTEKKNFIIKILEFLGIHFPHEENDILHISKRFLFFLLFILIGMIIFFAGFAEYSTSPSFCGTCHIMKPFYKAWKASSHNMVSCVDCHYPPGFAEKIQGKIAAISQVVKYVTRTYGTKPYAEIDDRSCLRSGCHDKRLLQGKVKFKQGIIFDHTNHLGTLRRGKKLRCTSCHSQIVIGNHIAVTEEVCFLCHFKDVDINNSDKLDPQLKKMSSCTNCHEPPSGDIKLAGLVFNHQDYVNKGVSCLKCHSEVIQGNGEVPKERCYNCHGEPERLEKYKDDVFMHKNHVTDHKVECTQCHLAIKHKVKTDVSPIVSSCNTCHENKHEGIKNMYMGTGGKGVSDSPNVMYIAQVDCVGCHIIPKGNPESFKFNGKTKVAGNISCISCHSNDYDGMVEVWKEDINKNLKITKELLTEVESIIEKNADKEESGSIEFNRLLNDAQFNIHFVEFANGVHNPDYALKLLEVAKENLDKAKELVQ